MFEARLLDGPDEPPEDYELVNEAGETLVSPFPVLVVGLQEELLGVGQVVGKFSFGERDIPIIELEDPNAPTGKVHLFSSECVWDPDVNEEYVTALQQAIELDCVTSPYEYACRLDASYQAKLN